MPVETIKGGVDMGRFLVRLIVDILISAVAIGLTAVVLPGIHIAPFSWTTLCCWASSSASLTA